MEKLEFHKKTKEVISHTKEFDHINIAVKYFGIFIELWQETPQKHEDKAEFLQRVKNEYRIRFKNREIKLTLVYKPYIIMLK